MDFVDHGLFRFRRVFWSKEEKEFKFQASVKISLVATYTLGTKYLRVHMCVKILHVRSKITMSFGQSNSRSMTFSHHHNCKKIW